MLDIINGLANGWVVAPVVSAFARYGVFDAMSGRPLTLKKLVSRFQGNSGHLHAALRLLYETGWVEWIEQDRYLAAADARLAQQLPSDLDELVQLSVAQALATDKSEPSECLLRWLERCCAGWASVEPRVVSLLDGALLAPLLAQLYTLGSDVLEQKQSGAISAIALQAIQTLFIQRGWAQVEATDFRLTLSGRALLAGSGALGTIVSYRPMFSHIEDLLFGEAQTIFSTNEQGHELHIDRTLNVMASGVQHQSHFAELDTLILRIFDQSPLEAQPRYVADMGCGDGSLLQRIYELVKTRTARGRVLAEYPLTLIGVDYNTLSLEATGRTLTGLPHLLVQGDIANPKQLMVDLATAGITDPKNILHVRSFLDHDRPFLPVEDKTGAQRREGLNYSGVYVARDGSEIKPAYAVQGLVEHLRRWRTAVSRFGLLLLEVHCLQPKTVRCVGNMTESAYYDAFHAFSGQQLVEASVFLMAAAEAGLFPELRTSQAIPKRLDFTRISLHRLLPQPYTVRHPRLADLRRLKQLDRISQPSARRTPAAEIKRRVRDFAQGQMVLEFEGQIVAALYTQRIDSPEALCTSCHAELARLHRPEGRYVQLLGLFVAPDMQGRGFSDALIDLMLVYAATLEGVDAVIGVTRCANFIQHKAIYSFDQYTQLRDGLGQFKDPMLHFHASHGAVVRKVLPGFRPEDRDNQGAGILIEYTLRAGAATTAETEVQPPVSECSAPVADQIEPAVRNTIMQVLGRQRAAAYGLQVPLMEMGLSSLELLELRLLLSARMGESLTATFLFSYGTPEAITGYFMTQATSRSMPRATTTPVLEVTPTSAIPALPNHCPSHELTNSEEAIAIIGMACHLPGGANNPAQFWQKLLEAQDAVGALPANRRLLWTNRAEPCRWQGGFLKDVDSFDAEFFRISPREAELLDPQQRFLLEVAWEALESAAIAPAMLRGTRSGVFVGMMGGDYEDVIASNGRKADINAHFATGNACSVAAGRLSYFFDWQGPALSIDTACSSSLVAVHTACRSLLGGECNLALAAGVNLLLDEKRFLAYEQAGMLSPDGRCRTFDASANGYVRGEGCAAVILKRLSDAQADGDPIIAVILGSAINQDGSSSGLTAPSQLAQQAVIEAALAQAKVESKEISYLEAHGTGTKLGDPIEVMAAAQVLGAGRPSDQPLLLGSLKSVMGHLEAAAGIAGLIKTVLSIQHGVIPEQLHFETPNPHIPWERLPVQVVAQTQAWPAGLKRAGVSSFGFSGTNAHVIVGEYLAPKRVPTEVSGPQIVVLSAKNEERLREQAQHLLAYLECHDEVNLADLAYTLQVGREALEARLALAVSTVDGLKKQLLRYVRGEAAEDIYQGEAKRAQAMLTIFGADEDLQQVFAMWAAKGKLGKLAQLWVQGLAVEWGRLYGAAKPKRISLPTYPFAKERYWVPAVTVRGNSEHQLHPLVHRNTSSLSKERFSTILTGQEFFLSDHVVRGERVVPGVVQLEWARAAVVLASDGHGAAEELSVVLQEVTWSCPLVITQPQEVHIALELQEDGRIGFEIYSERGGETVVYSQGWAQLAEIDEARWVDLEAVREPCEKTLAGEAFYARCAQSGLTFGPSFQVLNELWLGNNLAVGALNATGEALVGYEWIPNLLDGALQTSLGLMYENSVHLVLPFTVAQVRQWGEIPTTAWAVVRPSMGDSTAMRKFDIDIVDATGRVVLCLTGFGARPAHKAVDDVATVPPPAQHTLPESDWVGELILAPVWEVIEEKEEAWPLPQQRVALMGSPDASRSAWFLHYPQAQQIDLTGAESLEALTDRLRSDSQFDHLVWWVPSANALATQLGFRLIKALLALGYGSRSLGLTVVTRQAQTVWSGEEVDATAASVHGLIGSLAKEYAHWRIRLLDVPADEDIALASLLRLPSNSQGEARAYRHGQWYQQRLAPCALPAVMDSPYRMGGVYVILGGAGGLGIALSEYLIRHYQAQVVWLGRRTEDASIAQQRARLGAFGPTPLYLQADATEREALVLAHTAIRQRFGEIHGVVHAAIVLADQSLAQMDEASFEAAWLAKAASTLHLTEIFGQEELDFLLFFSSLLSFIKPPGQSNYVAGCCYTDAFAQALRNQHEGWKYPVKIMHWGYWGSVGAVASASYRERMAQMGLDSIEPPEAMAALEQLLAHPIEQLIFVKTTQAAAAGALKIAQETVTVVLATPAVVLPPVETVALPQEAAQDLTNLDKQLAPLLHTQLAAMGWLGAEAYPSERYAQWHAHSLRLLEAHGLLAQIPTEEPAQLWAKWIAYCAAAQDNPALRAQVQLVNAMLRTLPTVLRGERAATEVLFPQGQLDQVEGVYCGHPVADYFNAVLTERLITYVQARLQEDPQTRLRILEIGAGTGGTSAALFAQLSPYMSQIEAYCYTDVSPAFLLHAQQHYASQAPYLQTQRLDIERDPIEQDFALGHYDVVVAANVLHATHDIRCTLRHVKALLKGNGLLLLNELTDTGLFFHLTFGLLDGWWLAEDSVLRNTGTPGLKPSMWKQVLTAEGFKAITFPAEAAHGFSQQVVSAFSDGIVHQRRRGESQISPASSDEVALQTVSALQTPRQLPSEIQIPQTIEQQLALHVRRCICEGVAKTLKVDAEKLVQNRAFAEYGVDSITGVALVNAINTQLGLTLPTTVLFDYATIEQLSSHIISAHWERLKLTLTSVMQNPSAPAKFRKLDGARRQDGQPSALAGSKASMPWEPIAVIGMSGRFARANNLQALWAALAKGEDLTEEVSRWDLSRHYSPTSPPYCKRGGFLRDIDCFDPLFFNISGLEATYMDPQQRLFLEEAWRALEDAGYAGAGIAGQRCGVYVGCSAGDYQNLVDAAAPPQALWGNANSVTPARIAYHLNLQGPALAIDTACSSSLVALHQACQSLRTGEVELALAGGVFVQSTESFYVLANRAGMLSPTGHCYTFDARADGFVPSEGVGVVVLKRLSQAQTDGDHIYGVILGSGTNQDGATNGITAPSAISQERLERDVQQSFQIDPKTIQWVEAHGTGTVLGDPIEFRALTQAFNQGESRSPTLGLGSIKSNLGHTVAAAGIAGVLKILLALQHRQIPPSLHFVQGNPHIDFEHSPFYINTELKAWETGAGTERRAAVSSFSLSGTNAHAVIGEVPARIAQESSRPSYLIVLSARTPEQLRRQAEQLVAHCQQEMPEIEAMSHTLWMGRHHCDHRLGCIAQNSAQVMERLQQWLTQGKAIGVTVNHIKTVQDAQSVLVRLGKQCLEEYNKATVVEDAQESLAVIADLYCQGYDLPWTQLFDQIKPQRISLPTYPFAKERYWVPRMVAQGGPECQLHPLVHRNTSDLSEQRFSTTLTGEEFFLRDHVVQGERVVPGAVQLEWARAAVALASPSAAGQVVMLEEVTWLRPLVVAQAREVHIGLEAQEDGRIGFEIYTANNGDEVAVYSQGWAELQLTEVEVGEAPWVDLEALQGQCEQSLAGEECYARFAQQGLNFGPSFQVLNELSMGHHLAIGTLRLAAEAPVGYLWAPNLLDGALQASVGLTQATVGETVALLFSVARVKQWGEIPTTAWAVVHPSPSVRDGAALRKFDVDIVDASGRVALRLSGLSTRSQHQAVDGTVTALDSTPPSFAVLEPGELMPALAREAIEEKNIFKVGGSETVATVPAAPAVKLSQAAPVTQPVDAMQDSADIEAQLAPLLRMQLAAIGWLTAETCPLEHYAQWHAHSLRLLEIHGLLTQAPTAEEAAQLWAKWEAYRAAVQDKPAQRIRVELVDATLRALPGVLRGELAATEVLFPQGRLDRVEGVYRNHPVADYFNAILAERLIAYVQARLQAEPQARLRILEIGAGTGGTSTALFAQLMPYAAQIEEYCYTDMSVAFLLHAQQHYASQAPYLRTQRLDIERDPMAQDFARGHYDVVVAANVLHATRDICHTVHHAKTLLKGNGLLLLNELTNTGLFIHLTFGLLDGWWLAKDKALRMEGSPGLTPSMWRQVLAAEGFRDIAFPAYIAHGLGQQIVVAVSDGMVCQMVPMPEVSEQYLPRETVVSKNLSTAGELQPQIEHALAGIISTYLKVAREVLDRDAPLSQFGFDSITLAGLSNTLNQKYSLALSPPLFFEYSTIAALAGYLAREHHAVLAPAFAATMTEPIRPNGSAVASPLPPAARHQRGRLAAATLRYSANEGKPVTGEPIAVIGMSGCFPQAEDIDALWANLLAERDSISVLPLSRWNYKWTPTIGHAGVIENIDQFDPLFFGISPREAQAMDPQQRLLMLYVYRVLEDAGYSVRSLSGSTTALLVGATTGSGYGDLLVQAGEAVTGYSAGGLSGAMGPNRVSYWLNWHGPSEAIDTACSSSLVAVHRALELLRSGQCEQAVAGGVNTLLSREVHESYIQAGMLSKSGRCKTFSAQADGYVRGEGMGMVFLKPLSAAERDGDHIYGLIKGSATNHGGRAHSLTAPNPRAQADLVKMALQQAKVEPETIGYIEAHGTGTPLGDPIEIQGLKSAFAELAPDSPAGYCGLGTVKSNIGHLEQASGVVGLIKVLLQLQHQILVKSLHCDEVNPLLALEHSPFYVVQQTQRWEALRDRQGRPLPRRAGVSSFGAGGSNAHVIVEEYVKGQKAPTIFTGPVLVVMSARSEEQLKEQAGQLVAYLKCQTEVNLVDLAYTLQVGREPLGVRLALVAESVDAVREQLSHYVCGEVAEDIYRGECNRNVTFLADEDLQKMIQVWMANGKLSKLAELWVQGLEVEWAHLNGGTKPNRIRLPTYPFAKERYWVRQTERRTEPETQLYPPMHEPELSQPRPSTTPLGTLNETGSTKISQAATDERLLQIEDVLTGLISEQLNIAHDELGREIPFNDFGLDSIMLTRFSSALNQKYDLSLNPAIFLKYSTITKLARPGSVSHPV
ncbi:SDR family NAD(P)-dependent oxidoreductase [Mycoavidus sp. B2-EB]|uniref:SDR family NAD(P)-dependent oxidoreductase n=1 Tax=Mycoavidus sp. B2-EB TaxID=2651972 RepID=UPI001628BB65|nr:SDR family NAD(P)-dependent oxidoreductase [Mycoavidus sp. B2-EB]BBO59205.1 multifunctional polyketide-peptide synthase [Mycoavidus sp. B2-EB]